MITAIETASEIRDAIIKSADEGARSPLRVNLAELVKVMNRSVDSTRYHNENWLTGIFIEKTRSDTMYDVMDAILEYGLLCPLNVIRHNDEIVMGNGNHRLVASLLCGIEYIDIIVTDTFGYDLAGGIDWESSEMEWLESEFSYTELVNIWNKPLKEIWREMQEAIQEM